MSKLLMSYPFSSGQRLEIAQGDLSTEAVDAIVNAANSHLQHGGGVAGAIARWGGPVIQAESNVWVEQHGPVTHSEPAYTSAGRLPCRYVIHAVGPVWGEGLEDQKLAAAVRGSLQLADRLQLESVALPAISTGIFGFPKERAAQVILQAIRDYAEQNPASGLKIIRLTLYDDETVQAFKQAWERMGLGDS